MNQVTQATANVDKFLAAIRPPRGRLIFALDATMSRQPTWDRACHLQSEMFRAADTLAVQLVYYRGESECRASRWISDTRQLAQLMQRIDCRAGETQIRKVLEHAARENAAEKVAALVLIGDAVEENPDTLAHLAGALGIPAFMFQEGGDRTVEGVFREIASATRGAYARFKAGSAQQLATLLRAVAVFAVGGRAALAAQKDDATIKLLGQMR
jgi:hypothetical protein